MTYHDQTKDNADFQPRKPAKAGRGVDSERPGTSGSAAGISRRNFLALSATAAAGTVLTGAGLTAADNECLNTNCKTLQSLPWDQLARELQGHLVTRGDQEFLGHAKPTNMHFSQMVPVRIALCETQSDVRRCIEWVRETDTSFAVRSGGHNYAGFSSTGGLLIDVSRMKSVDIDRNTGDLILGPGNRGSDVDPKLRSENIMFPMGRCPAVAVSGLTLGGGWSMYARHYGMACDSLLETTLVTPDARILTCSESENADLFWALRGGGGGNFGINTSFRFRTVGVSNTTVFKMIWLFPDKPAQIMEKLLHVAVHAPSTFSLEATAAPATPFPRHGLLLSVAGHMFGSESDVKELMQPAFNAEAPLSSLIWRTSFWNAKEILSDSAPFGFFRHKSAFAGTNVSTSLDMAEMIEWIRQWPATSQVPDAAFGFYSFGGKVNAVSKDETAFVHRSSELLFKFETTWGENDPPEVICATSEWLEKFFEKARAGLSPYSYQNFPDPDLENWANAYYGSNLPRLIKLKQKIDPTNLFHFLQSIPVRMPGAM